MTKKAMLMMKVGLHALQPTALAFLLYKSADLCCIRLQGFVGDEFNKVILRMTGGSGDEEEEEEFLSSDDSSSDEEDEAEAGQPLDSATKQRALEEARALLRDEPRKKNKSAFFEDEARHCL